MSDFEFPAVFIGCPVEISSDPSESDKTLGWIFECGNGSANVISINGRTHMDCWHADDPRCQSQSGVFQDFDDRGVFRLTEGEVQRRQLFARMATLEGRLADHELKFRELARAHQQQAEQPKQRGRKQVRSAAEAMAEPAGV
jgi:hypothetical protein